MNFVIGNRYLSNQWHAKWLALIHMSLRSRFRVVKMGDAGKDVDERYVRAFKETMYFKAWLEFSRNIEREVLMPLPPIDVQSSLASAYLSSLEMVKRLKYDAEGLRKSKDRLLLPGICDGKLNYDDICKMPRYYIVPIVELWRDSWDVRNQRSNVLRRYLLGCRNVKKIGEVASVRREKCCVSMRWVVELDEGGAKYAEQQKCASAESGQNFYRGDVLLSRTIRNNCYRAWSVDCDGVASNKFIVLTCDRVLPGYLEAYWESTPIKRIIEATSRGTSRGRLQIKDVLSFMIPVPSMAEQTAIMSEVGSKIAKARTMEAQAAELTTKAIQTFESSILNMEEV